MSYFMQVRHNVGRDIKHGYRILRSRSFVSNMMNLKYPNEQMKEQYYRNPYNHLMIKSLKHTKTFKMTTSFLSTLSGKSMETKENKVNLKDDTTSNMESHSKHDKKETIHLQYPRIDSFSDDDIKHLESLLGISNMKIKNNSYTNTHIMENNVFPQTKKNFQKTNSNKKSYQQLPHRRKRIVTTPSTIPKNSTIVTNDDIPLKVQSKHDNQLTSNEWIKKRIRVKSIHASRTIDIVSVISKVFSGKDLPKPLRYRFGKSSVIVQLPPIFPESTPSPSSELATKPTQSYHNHLNDIDSISVRDAFPTKKSAPSLDHDQNPNMSYHGNDLNRLDVNDDRMRYIVAFRYGSVVFFNVAPIEAQKILQEIKKHSTDPIATGFEQKEHFEVAICPGLDTQLQHGQKYTQNPNNANLFPNQPQMVNADYAIVKQLDMNYVAVISTIMAQTVAMDSYNITVDELLATFAKINTIVKKEGKFTEMEREALSQVVAMNNAIFIDMVSKLGVMDRSDTAWNFSQYENVFEEMQNEFEIYRRFDNIEFKLNLIQENAKFFLTTFHSRQSNTLEWVIIVLIAFECVLMCLDMSGMGSVLFSTFSLDFMNPADVSANDALVENTDVTNKNLNN